MRINLPLTVLLALLLVAHLGRADNPPQPDGKAKARGLDLLLIVDTSKSMRGLGGGANIFGRVKDSCIKLAKELEGSDSRVSVMTFDSKVNAYPPELLAQADGLARLKDQFKDLQAEGNKTHLTRALREGLKRLGSGQAEDATRLQVAVILTDGVNDPPPGAEDANIPFEEVVRPYVGMPWFVYYLQLGDEVEQELVDVVKRTFPNGGTIHDPKATRLSSMLDSLNRVVQHEQARLAEQAARTKAVLDSIEAARQDSILKAREKARQDSQKKWTSRIGYSILALALAIGCAWLLLQQKAKRRLHGTLDWWVADNPAIKGQSLLDGLSGTVTVGRGHIALAGADRVLLRLRPLKEGGRQMVSAAAGDPNAAGQVAAIQFQNHARTTLTLYNNDEFKLERYCFRYRGATGLRPRG